MARKRFSDEDVIRLLRQIILKVHDFEYLPGHSLLQFVTLSG